jgi:D-sedoheptulose 7-phosphate isomerase
MKSHISAPLDKLIENYPSLKGCRDDIVAAYERIAHCLRSGAMLLVCGNGGSASDAEHMVGELMKSYEVPRPIPEADARKISAFDAENGRTISVQLQCSMRAISLASQTSLISAIANDTSADMVFAQQVYGYGREDDVLMAISTSGNAVNVCNAAGVARALGLGVIGLTGASGGRLKNLCDIAICIPEEKTYRIQEHHQPVYHAICAMLEQEFFGEKS